MVLSLVAFSTLASEVSGSKAVKFLSILIYQGCTSILIEFAKKTFSSNRLEIEY